MESVAFERLCSALAGAAPSISLDDLSVRVASVSAIEADEVYEVLSVAASLYQLRDLQGLTPSAIAADVVEAAIESHDYDDLSPDRSQIHDRLARLFGFDRPIGVSAKAFGVLGETEHLYCRARVITDLRPVFVPGSSERAEDSVVIHFLRISYHEGLRGDTRDFIVSLQPDDLKALRDQLNRAFGKETALREIASRGGIPCLPYKLSTTS